MLDDFFVRALVAGIGVALIAAPLGCFIVWRRMAYFGDAIAHSALLGVAIAFMMEIDITIAVFFVAALASAALLLLQRNASLSSDSLLGVLSHSALALGLVAIAFMTSLRVDLMGYLFGDILAVGKSDILVIYGGGALAMGVLAKIWRTLLAETVSFELASAEGLSPAPARFAFMLLVALVIAISMKIVGILLITALLIIPAAAARRFARTPEQMALGAALIGVASVVGGLYGSMTLDAPSGPSIVVAALLLFLLAQSPFGGMAAGLRRLRGSSGRGEG